MKETIASIILWHQQTFPDATLEGQIEKWDDERLEWEDTSSGTPDELLELADMVIVCCGIMRFDYAEGFNYLASTLGRIQVMPTNGKDLWGAVERKMAINRNRKWNKIGNTFQHISEGGEE